MARIFEIDVTLDDVEPPIWRRIQLPHDCTLGDLHDVIQIAMGWEHADKIKNDSAA